MHLWTIYIVRMDENQAPHSLAFRIIFQPFQVWSLLRHLKLNKDNSFQISIPQLS
jgi:hypothetical protein